MKLQAHGIETDLPFGWEGRIALRHPAGSPDESSFGDVSLQGEPGALAGPDKPDMSVLSEGRDLGEGEAPPEEPNAGEEDLTAEDLSDVPSTTNPTNPDAPDAPVAPDAPQAPSNRSNAPLGPLEPVVDGEQHFPVAHLANFPLPEDRGDFGSGAVDIMTAGDILLVLAEFGPECVNTPLFSPRDLPTRLTPNMFSGSALQRSHEGQAGCQIFFTYANRAFCLYTVLGRQSAASRVLPQANATLAATRITPR